MRVKIGNQWHDSRDEPICVQLSPREQQQIKEMDRTVAREGKFASFPDSGFYDREAMLRWLSDDDEEDSSHG